MILETRHLRLVAAVAEHGTLTRAGRVLHLTQSGLSRQLLDLETRLGLPLFHRLGKRMVPTPAGERLLAAARRALPQLSDVEEEMRRLAGGRSAILRVSTECYTCYHWLPGVLQRFARDRKSTRLNSSHRCISYAVFCLKKKTISETLASPD